MGAGRAPRPICQRRPNHVTFQEGSLRLIITENLNAFSAFERADEASLPRLANSEQGDYKHRHEDIEIEDGPCVCRCIRLSDANLVQVNSGRAEHKDAPANGRRGPKAVPKLQTEQSEYPERQVGHGDLILEGIPRRPANRRRNGDGSQRVPDEADKSAQPDGEREEIEQQHVCDSLFGARLLSNCNMQDAEKQSDCREDDKDHGLAAFRLKDFTRPVPAVFQIADHTCTNHSGLAR